MKRSAFIFAILSAALFSCKDRIAIADNNQFQENEVQGMSMHYEDVKMSLGDFMNWCADPENGLSKNQKVSEINYSLSYLPSENMSFLDLRRQTYDLKKLKEVCANYNNMLYFNFKIELINGQTELLKYDLKDASEYEKRINYISFDMQKDIYVLQNGDTIYPSLYQFERIFNVAPYSKVMIAFDGKALDKSKEFSIVYNDKLFEKGTIKFNYRDKQLTDLPNVTEL